MKKLLIWLFAIGLLTAGCAPPQSVEIQPADPDFNIIVQPYPVSPYWDSHYYIYRYNDPWRHNDRHHRLAPRPRYQRDVRPYTPPIYRQPKSPYEHSRPAPRNHK